jgi:hypothetical protein
VALVVVLKGCWKQLLVRVTVDCNGVAEAQCGEEEGHLKLFSLGNGGLKLLVVGLGPIATLQEYHSCLNIRANRPTTCPYIAAYVRD